ncbi:hypothetical protein D3C85_563380 [compost metagenome]
MDGLFALQALSVTGWTSYRPALHSQPPPTRGAEPQLRFWRSTLRETARPTRSAACSPLACTPYWASGIHSSVRSRFAYAEPSAIRIWPTAQTTYAVSRQYCCTRSRTRCTSQPVARAPQGPQAVCRPEHSVWSRHISSQTWASQSISRRSRLSLDSAVSISPVRFASLLASRQAVT